MGGRQPWLRARLLEALAEMYGIECCRCGAAVDITVIGQHPRSPSFDHLIATALGGPDNIGNLRIAHLRCNREHGTRLSMFQAQGTAIAAQRGGGWRRRRAVPAPDQEPLFDLPRRRFLIAVPAVLAAARLAPAPPSPPRRDFTVRPWRFGTDDVTAVTTIPDEILDNAAINTWAWVRPRLAEAISAALPTAIPHRREWPPAPALIADIPRRRA